jgi:hypothetical protein
MRSIVKMALLTGAMVLASSATAAAADMCFLRSNGALLILKAFSLPAKGACKDVRGFYPAEPSVGPFWVTGSACGSSDGDHISFVQTWMPRGTAFIVSGNLGSDQFTVKRLTLTGEGRSCSLTGSDCDVYYSIARVACNPATVPVP